MNNADRLESLAASDICARVRTLLERETSPQDIDAAVAAVLCRALEFATPGLSPRARAALMEGDK